MSNYVKRFQPDVMSNNDDMKSLYQAQSDEIENLNSSIKTEINNNFISSSNSDGVTRWEKIYNLRNNSDYTLEERKELLMNKIYFKPPFTRQRFMQILENVWGDGNYTFVLYPDIYELIIDIYTSNPLVYLKFKKYVRDVVPANIYLIFSIQYTYLYLNRNYTYNRFESENLTYGDLSQYA